MITLPGAGVLAVLRTYALRSPFFVAVAVRVPPETVFVSPVTASTYVPLGMPENVALPETTTHTKLSVLASVYLLLNARSPLTPSVEYCPLRSAGIA